MTTREDQQGGESADPSMPPPEFFEKCAKACRCCPSCADVPCEGTMAGGICDERCRCDDERGDEYDCGGCPGCGGNCWTACR
jgi:hypothetical protein